MERSVWSGSKSRANHSNTTNLLLFSLIAARSYLDKRLISKLVSLVSQCRIIAVNKDDTAFVRLPRV